MKVLWIWSRFISFSVIVTVLILVSSVRSRQQDYGKNYGVYSRNSDFNGKPWFDKGKNVIVIFFAYTSVQVSTG